MKKEWKWIRVPEDTRRLAKKLAAEKGMTLNDYVRNALEMSKDANMEGFKTRKKDRVMGFELRF